MSLQATTTTPPAADLSTKVIEWSDVFELGCGVDFLSRQPRRSVLKGFPDVALKATVGSASQTTRASMKWVQTKEELVETLNAELRGSGALSTVKGGGGGSFFANYLSRTKITKYNLNCVLLVQVVNDPAFVSDLAIAEDLKNALPADFLGKYGDHILAGLRTGGLYLGVIEIVTDTEEKKQEVKAQIGMRGHGGPQLPQPSAPTADGDPGTGNTDATEVDDGDSGKIGPDVETGKKILGGDGTLSTALSRVSMVEGVQIISSVDRVGGSGPVKFDQPSSMVADAERFPGLVGDRGVKLSAIIKPYGLLRDLPDVRAESVFHSQYLHHRDVLESRALRAISVIENLEYALDPKHLRAFAEKESELKQLKAEAEAHLRLVNRLLQELGDDPRGFVVSGKAAEIPAALDLGVLPNRKARDGRVITPAVVPSLNPMVGRLAEVKEQALLLKASDRFVVALNDLGALLHEQFTLQQIAVDQLSAMLQRVRPRAVEFRLEELRAKTRKLRRMLEQELPPRLGRVAALHDPEDAHAHILWPVSDGQADPEQRAVFAQQLGMLIAELRPDGNGRTGGLFPHVVALEKALAETDVVVALTPRAKLATTLRGDAMAWGDLSAMYAYACDRLSRRYPVKVAAV